MNMNEEIAQQYIESQESNWSQYASHFKGDKTFGMIDHFIEGIIATLFEEDKDLTPLENLKNTISDIEFLNKEMIKENVRWYTGNLDYANSKEYDFLVKTLYDDVTKIDGDKPKGIFDRTFGGK